MRKVLGGVAVAVTVAFGLACSGMNLPIPGAPGGGGGAGNADACKKYVEAFNNAACSAVDLSAADVCPENLNLTPCDMSAYYGCMADSVKCNGEFLDVSGQANCAAPTCN
ncbi:MAG: hypothetical protein ABMA64_23850 [Myxococcota bacterium]